MLERKREIYIRLENVKEIVETIEEIKKLESELRKKFLKVESLNIQENRLFENWNSYYEDIVQKLDHVTL